MSYDISVIIPLYNTEKFVRQCVDSVLAQTLTNIEVIIVNDCSTDNGPALCAELYGNNERVRIVHHEKNAGLGASRDTGTLHATGRYIYYVDSDDEIMPDHLSNMFKTALEYDADVVHNTNCITLMPKQGETLPAEMLGLPEEDLIIFSPDRHDFKETTLLPDDLNARLDDWEHRRYYFSAWNSMYKRSFLKENDITFNKVRFAEDTVFYFQCLFNAKNFVVRPGGGYIYRITDTSLSRGKKTPQSAVKAIHAQLEIVELMKRVSSRIPFFKNSEENTRRAIDTLLKSLEDGFVRPAFQSLGEDGMRDGGTVSSFFTENFGDKAPYVEFLFYELHKIYPPIVDYVGATSNPDEWRKLNEKK